MTHEQYIKSNAKLRKKGTNVKWKQRPLSYEPRSKQTCYTLDAKNNKIIEYCLLYIFSNKKYHENLHSGKYKFPWKQVEYVKNEYHESDKKWLELPPINR